MIIYGKKGKNNVNRLLNIKGGWYYDHSPFLHHSMIWVVNRMAEHKIIAYVEDGEVFEPYKAKFFYQNDKVFYEVTKEVFDAIHKYNIYVLSFARQGKYRLYFPFQFENHYITYPKGFGETHFFVEHEFDRIDKYVRSFPLKKCELEVIKVEDIENVKMNKKHMVLFQKKKEKMS